MNSILDNFDFISRSPGGVALLRKLVLELAVRGKLVSQDAKDEPASVLLERIKREKARLVKEEKIKAGKKIPEIKEKEKPFKLPSGWVWVRLGELIDQVNGRAFKPTEWQTTGLPIVRIQNLNNPTAAYNFCNREAIEEKYLIKKDDILISWSGTPGTSFGAFLWRGKEAALNQHINRVVLFGAELYQKDYLVLMVNSQLDILISEARGAVGLRHVTMGQLNNLYVPLPPLAEQSRIVARVQELMAVLDRLEVETSKTEEVRNRALIAATKAVSQAATHEDLASSWLRLAKDFDRLIDRAEDVKTIRDMVLDLAVRGKLVPQKPEEEPASVLLKFIRNEKTRLANEGKIKSEKELPEIKPEEKPYELPRGWAWERLGNISTTITSGSRDWANHYSVTGPIFVRMGNLSKDSFQLRMNSIQHVSPPDQGEGTRTHLEEGDLLISITGDVGWLGLIPQDFGEAYINQHVALVRLSSLMSPLYVPYYALSSLAIGQFDAPQRGLKNSFRLGDLEKMLVPVPPLSEQNRIVACVQKLMPVLDRLEEKLAARDNAAVLASESLAKMNQV
jgi:type I restriction enzyme S subunit